MHPFLLLVALVAATVLLAWLCLRFELRERFKRRELESRPKLSDSHLRAKFYREFEATIPERVRCIYAEWFGFDPESIYPSDNLVRDFTTDMDTIGLIETLEDDLGVRLPQDFLNTSDGSLDSVIRCIASSLIVSHFPRESLVKNSFDWNAYLNKLFAAKIASPRTIRGCTEEEIASLEKRYRVSLPGIYRDFLHFMGHAQGELPGGDYQLYKDLDDIQEFMKEASEDYAVLPAKAFAFGMDGGSTQCLFFICDDNSYDPPVYRYTERHDSWTCVQPSFSAFLESHANEIAAYLTKFSKRI